MTYYVPVAAPDFDQAVALNQVPATVLDTASRMFGGYGIASVDYIRRGGSLFYDVRVVGSDNTLQVLRIGVDGGFICMD